MESFLKNVDNFSVRQVCVREIDFSSEKCYNKLCFEINQLSKKQQVYNDFIDGKEANMEKLNLTEEERQLMEQTTKWKDAVEKLRRRKERLEEKIDSYVDGTVEVAKRTVDAISDDKERCHKSKILVQFEYYGHGIYKVEINGKKDGASGIDTKMYEKLLVQSGFNVKLETEDDKKLIYSIDVSSFRKY